MAEITSSGAVNRHITECLTTDPRVKQYKCKTFQNPDYYKTPVGLFLPSDVTNMALAQANIGQVLLRGKNHVTVGMRTADNAYKFIGLRPDEKQDGSEQLEFSLEGIEINGKKQTIRLNQRQQIVPVTYKLGNIYIQSARQRTRFMWLANNAVDGFKISLRLHLTGLTVQYRADLDEYWLYSGKGEFRFRLGKPYLIDPATMNPLEINTSLVKHSLTDLGGGEYLYVKEPTAAFATATLPASFLIDADTVYSTTADGWVLHDGEATWAASHNAADGYSSSAINSEKSTGIMAQYSAGTTFDINRSFFYYDLAALSGTVSSVYEKLSSYFYEESSICSQLGTQAASLGTTDYNNFSGTYYGSSAWSSNKATINYGAGGISDVQAVLGGTFKTCVREYDHDYLNVTPGTSTYRNGVRYTETAGTASDPYLYITMVAAGTAVPAYCANMRRTKSWVY